MIAAISAPLHETPARWPVEEAPAEWPREAS